MAKLLEFGVPDKTVVTWFSPSGSLPLHDDLCLLKKVCLDLAPLVRVTRQRSSIAVGIPALSFKCVQTNRMSLINDRSTAVLRGSLTDVREVDRAAIARFARTRGVPAPNRPLWIELIELCGERIRPVPSEA